MGDDRLLYCIELLTVLRLHGQHRTFGHSLNYRFRVMPTAAVSFMQKTGLGSFSKSGLLCRDFFYSPFLLSLFLFDDADAAHDAGSGAVAAAGTALARYFGEGVAVYALSAAPRH